MEVVLVLNVQIPTADVCTGHVVAAQLGSLDVPDVLLAAGVLVTDLHSRGRDAIHPLKILNYFSFSTYNEHFRKQINI